MQTIGGREPLHGDLGRFYDAIENPRRTRGELPILRDAELRAYLADVRERTLEVLDGVRRLGPDAEDPLLRDGFVYEMLLAHELQHNETMLQLLQMVDGYEPRAGRPPSVAGARSPRSPRCSPSPPASTRSAPRRAGFAYDNERGRHTVELGAFEIDRTPVSQRRLRPLRRGDRRRAADVLGARRRAGRPRGRDPVDPAPGHPRLLARGRRLRPLGRQAAADRARVGGRQRPSSTASGGPGSGPPPTSSPTPASRPSPTREYSQVFFGDELQGAARRLLGDPPERDAAQLPQLGPAPAPPDLLRHPLREGRMSDRDRGPPRRRGLGDDGAGRPPRPADDPEGALAEVLLRRARLAALRADHRARRVLPDPRRARDPQPSARPRSSPRPASRRTLVELGSGSAAKTRHLLSAMRDAGCLRDLRPGRHLRGDHPARPPSCWSTSTRASTCAASSATSSTTWSASPTPAKAADRLPRRHDRQPLPLPAPLLHVPDRRADVPRRPLPARHRPDQGPGPPRGRLRRRRGGHRRVQQERARGPQPRARRRLRPRRLRARRPLRRATRSGWTSACARSPTSGSGSRASTSTVEFAAGEELRTEISTKFTRERLEEIYAHAGPRALRLVHRRGRRLRAQPRAPAR